MSQWMAMLGTLRAVLQPSESEERGGARGSAAPSTGMDSPAVRPQVSTHIHTCWSHTTHT